MAETIKRLTDDDWEMLTRRIRDGKCTIFLGAGVYSEGPSMRTRIARKWAKKYDYPMTDETDLARVARYLSVINSDVEFVPSKLLEELKDFKEPNFGDADDPYTILAKLPLPIYITTNYDDFMEQALAKQHREVRPDLCRWRDSIKGEPSPLAEGFEPTVANPSVFHLYGYLKTLESLVLTEDDFFQFLINVSKDQTLIPLPIQKAIAGASLMLLGFRLDDWDFRVLFHLLASFMKIGMSRTHVAVQMSTTSYEPPEDQKLKVQAFFDKYFESRRPDIRVNWDTTENFALKVKEKWTKSGYAT